MPRLILIVSFLFSCSNLSDYKVNASDILLHMKKVDSLHYKFLEVNEKLDHGNLLLKQENKILDTLLTQIISELDLIDSNYKYIILSTDTKQMTSSFGEVFNDSLFFYRYQLEIMSNNAKYTSLDLLKMYQLMYKSNYSISQQIQHLDFTGFLKSYQSKWMSQTTDR